MGVFLTAGLAKTKAYIAKKSSYSYSSHWLVSTLPEKFFFASETNLLSYKGCQKVSSIEFPTFQVTVT